MTMQPLPDPYPAHKHATAEMRQVAHDGLILLAEVGSGVHGLALGTANDDVDLMGLTVEHPKYITGLERFEQFELHTAWNRSGGQRERSGRGDYDYLIYGLRKFCALALQGNPSLINLLFIPDDAIHFDTGHAQRLREHADWFVSKQAADRYLGYLHRQRLGMTGEAGAKVKRAELVEQFGYDTKYAAHALRLGVQGCELMRTGRLTLPLRPHWRSSILAVKRGEESLVNVLSAITYLEEDLRQLRDSSDLPEQPNRQAVNTWLHETYSSVWRSFP